MPMMNVAFLGWHIGPENVCQADTLISHAVFNESIFSQHIVQGFKYIVPVRHPVKWIQSAVSYFAATRKISAQNVSFLVLLCIVVMV